MRIRSSKSFTYFEKLDTRNFLMTFLHQLVKKKLNPPKKIKAIFSKLQTLSYFNLLAAGTFYILYFDIIGGDLYYIICCFSIGLIYARVICL